MKAILHHIKSFLQSSPFKIYAKWFGYFILGCIAFVIIASGALSFYFNRNKTEIIAKINTKINENINGKFHVGDFQYKFLTGFPNFTLALKDVEIKDNQWHIHKHTLLKAKEIEARLNVWSLLQNEINIHKMLINDAEIYVYKAENGYSNADIFKPKKKKSPKNKSETETSIDQIDLNDVHFILDNHIGHKLFDFDIASLKSKVDFDDEDWQTDVFLKTDIKSLAFNTVHGSFAEQKILEGTFAVSYSAEKEKIDVVTKNLKIGTDSFDIVAFFNLAKGNALFGINISTTILWQNASNLLSANISSKLNRFNLKEEIDVNCDIKGDFNAEGDPRIVVQAEVQNNELSIPDGLITNCNFKGIFTNNFKPKEGYNDANSAVILTRFSGKYKNIPLKIPQLAINNLEKPLATGIVNSDFDIENLNEENTEKWIHFTEGHASANLKFQFDIVDLYITKPRFIGNVNVQNVSFHFIPKNLHAEKVNVQLDFTEKALLIKKIAYKHNKNIIYLEGKIDNFLNLYYDAPEKMIVNWDIYCPNIDLKQFLGVLASSQKKKITAKKATMSDQLRNAIEKCVVDINIKANKINYNKLTATNTKATVQMIDSRLVIKNGSLQTSGGSITFNTTISPNGKNYNFVSNAQVNRVDIASFLKSFNNFGITSFNPKNIKGRLSSHANVSGFINSRGELLTNSMHGKLDFNVTQGALLNFEPIVKVGKFAFPFRDVQNITFSDLSGNLNMRGEQIDVNNLIISSSVLNLDINGIYSFGRGTNLALTIPLRNSKNDAKLASQEERDAVRDRGIVLHLIAVDDEGKMKIKWGKKDKEK
ncbi:AsmA-like C-terminal region-containing protein [Flavobacterium sp. MMLR14_040]|uniref:AsmA family protein n=1 Tax=Flavobacterium sp. MMLR14_040 TaxID=3093843 RepID=UPI00298F4016|nr:AsmA-like C-terminal region-containing protein [Flavobacterium sp. MMLR14_040]MDW8849841.1 AsmA-like C-terminal region-containing protein [Flavobacterium sp. MMLR14_040]